MDNKLALLKDFGFSSAGRWLYTGNSLSWELHSQVHTRRNVLYAFSVNEDLAYVGLTTMALRERMRRYAHPPKQSGNGGGTNIKNNRNIVEALQAGKSIDIYVFLNAFTDEQCLSVTKPLHALESQLINLLSPPWNG